MAERAIDRIEGLVRRAAFGNLGCWIDLVAGGAADRLMRRALEQLRRSGRQLLAVSFRLIGRVALGAGFVVELLRACW